MAPEYHTRPPPITVARANLDTVAPRGLTEAFITKMEATLVDLKAQISEAKKVVKLALEPARWKQFGITQGTNVGPGRARPGSWGRWLGFGSPKDLVPSYRHASFRVSVLLFATR